MSSRNLDQSEAEQLIEQELIVPLIELRTWPGRYNLQLIAEAVNHRRQYVDLDGERFSIKYDETAKAVFVKPATESFVPCGWFGYKKLKEVLGD